MSSRFSHLPLPPLSLSTPSHCVLNAAKSSLNWASCLWFPFLALPYKPSSCSSPATKSRLYYLDISQSRLQLDCRLTITGFWSFQKWRTSSIQVFGFPPRFGFPDPICGSSSSVNGTSMFGFSGRSWFEGSKRVLEYFISWSPEITKKTFYFGKVTQKTWTSLFFLGCLDACCKLTKKLEQQNASIFSR